MNPTIIHVDEGHDIEAIRRALAHVPEVQIVDMSARGIVGMPSAAQFVLVDAARAGDRIAELVDHQWSMSTGALPDGPDMRRRSWNIETPKEEKQIMNPLLMLAAMSAGVPSMPGARDPFRRPERAPKPPAAIQDAIKAKADAKRARRNAKRLANAGMAS